MKAITLYDNTGKHKGTLPFDGDMPKKEISAKTYACAIKVLMQNWRQGTVGSKTRSQVAFSGKKPWRQKGTGRARVGAASSPLWRKGGVIFGPSARKRSLKMTQKQRMFVCNNAFFSLYESGNIHCVDMERDKEAKPSTKQASKLLKGMGIAQKKVIVLLDYHDHLTAVSFKNIPNVSIVYFDQPNSYDLTSGSCWIFFRKDADLFKGMVAKWN